MDAIKHLSKREKEALLKNMEVGYEWWQTKPEDLQGQKGVKNWYLNKRMRSKQYLNARKTKLQAMCGLTDQYY